MTDVQEHETIWYPDIYGGRTTDEYTQIAAYLPFEELVRLVQKRAEEDGEFCIANGFVGPNNESEPKMRRMMEFVSKETNIRQCLDHIHREGLEHERTVDFVCRDLANASKVMIR